MHNPANRLRTIDEVQKDFDERGLSVRAWALAAGVDPAVAAHVVKGRLKGRIGESHRVAVLLGLKRGVIEPKVKEGAPA